MKIGKFRLMMASAVLVAAVCLAFFIAVLEPEAAAPLTGAMVLMGMVRVGAALFKHRARLRFERNRQGDRFLPAGGEIA